MARVKRAVNAHKKRRVVLERASGYRGQRSRLYRKAKEQLLHSFNYNFRDRKARKGDFRKLWIQRINAAVRAEGITYNRFIQGLRLAGIELDRRALAEIAVSDPDTFKTIVDAAKAANMDAPRLDRLTLTPRIMADMADACLHVAEMADEVGVIEQQWQRPNGLMIGKMRIPLGVIAMIFESRPNVTIDAAILCLKAGDAVILRGGSEAIHSNLALAGLLHEALRSANLTNMWTS